MIGEFKRTGSIILNSVMENAGSMLERLIDLFQQAYQRVMETQDLFKMVHMLIFGPPQGVPSYDFDAYHRTMICAIQTIYIKASENGQVIEADPEEVAMLFLSVLHFCFHWGHVHPESSDPGRPERLLRLAFQGIKPV